MSLILGSFAVFGFLSLWIAPMLAYREGLSEGTAEKLSSRF